MFGVTYVCSRDGLLNNIVGHSKMAGKNNLVKYEETYRLMITFFIHKNDVFYISQIFLSFLVISETAFCVI